MPMLKETVSCILAGYNESKVIESSVLETLHQLENNFETFEIILIDDGSKDDSLEIMKKLEKTSSHIKVLDNIINLNFGASVLRGLYAAQYDFIIYNAMDLPLPPSEIRNVISDAIPYDVLVLERIEYKATFWRKITSFLNRLLLNILFPKCMSGNPVVNYIQVFKKDALPEIKPLARSPIFVWPEMIFRAKYKKMAVGNRKTIVQVDDVRKGSFGKPNDILWGIHDMLRFRYLKWRNKI